MDVLHSAGMLYYHRRLLSVSMRQPLTTSTQPITLVVTKVIGCVLIAKTIIFVRPGSKI